jgi:predicted NAD-dependent protein-ADP-ribosyltransferase YbiA (DUF1768 family)
MNIGSKSGYPSSSLSNFAPHPFIFDGVEISSMEGFLQSLKFDKKHVQEEVCKLVGLAAKFRGKKRNKAWKPRQTLWWKEIPYQRESIGYQLLLDRAYQAVFDQNEGFRKALLSTGNATLTHSIGSNKTSETVLTEREFCSRLTRLRNSYNNAILHEL